MRQSSTTVTIAIAVAVLAAFASISRIAVNAPFALRAAYVISAGALIVAYRRGGIRRFPFWITLIAAYPVLNTWLMRDVIGFELISARAPELQTDELMAAPLLAAAIACLFLSVVVSGQRLTVVRPVRSADWTPTTAALLSVGMMTAAWLTEPGPFIGLATYEEVFAGRYSGTAFAGGAWLVLVVLSLAAFMRETDLAVRGVVAAGIGLSMFWLLGHARRSEPMGLLLLAFCIFARRVSVSRRVLIWGTAICLFAVAGYVRDFRWDQAAAAAARPALPFFHLPGAPGNVLIGYVAAWSLRAEGLIVIPSGSTYFGYILSLPPSILGWPRPPGAYDIVNDLVPLSGGDYFMLEPVLNFGLGGAVGYLIAFGWICNWAITQVRRFIDGHAGILYYLVAGSFLGMLFRTFWYGLGAVVKTMLMAVLVAVGLELARILRPALRSDDGSRGARLS